MFHCLQGNLDLNSSSSCAIGALLSVQLKMLCYRFFFLSELLNLLSCYCFPLPSLSSLDIRWI